MLYELKSILNILLGIALMSLCVSCNDNISIASETPTAINDITIGLTEEYQTTLNETISETANTSTTKTDLDYTSLLELYPDESISQDLQSIQWSEDMVFTDLNSMQSYIDACISNCQEDIGLIVPYGYTIPSNESYAYFDKGVWSISGSQNILGHNENKAYFIVYHLKYTTGKLVYNAYLKQDTSTLTPEQLEVYNISVDFIENTLDTSKPVISQEKQIFDYICEKTSYYKNEDTSNQYDRYKSSIGVLVDGYANCMGYADTFFLLCSMANMNVTYVSEKSMNHAWNIITLDGKQYLVDTTFADTIYSSKNLISYEFFNASLEFVNQKYTLSNNNPTLNIQPTFDDNYYFYYEDFNPHIADSSNIYDTIASYIENGETLFEVMCEDTLPTTKEQDFIKKLSEKLPTKYSGKKIGCILQPFNSYGYVLISIG